MNQVVSRRSVLATSATLVAGVGTTEATAEVVADLHWTQAEMEACVEEVAPEHPWESARRLAGELSEILAADTPEGNGPAGEWFAEIHPVSGREYTVMFGSIEARNWPRTHRSQPCQRIIQAHSEARAVLEKTLGAVDAAKSGGKPFRTAERRYLRALRAEERALTAVCAFRPHGAADARAKARYLREFVECGEFTTDQVMALVMAGMPS